MPLILYRALLTGLHFPESSLDQAMSGCLTGEQTLGAVWQLMRPLSASPSNYLVGFRYGCHGGQKTASTGKRVLKNHIINPSER